MNKAITDGLVFAPAPFSAGLANWSRSDGTPGSDTYASLGTAAYVPADQDFGGALELQKTDPIQALRYMGQTPLPAGCYLRIRARIKAIAGNLPSVRIAGWAGDINNAQITNVANFGPSVSLTSYGEVVEVSAIVGAGQRPGVDMIWGPGAVYGHFGLDLTGPTGGIVRIDDIEIEDITSAFLRTMMDWVDVRDFGAVGDGVSDDTAAFLAADAAAMGRTVLVSAGTYRLAQDVTFDTKVRFEGTVTMPDTAILTLSRNFDLPAYIDAFGSEELAFRKAFQALLNNADHESLDLGGRRVSVTGPIDLAAAVPNRTSFAQRRVIRNGQLRAEDSGQWAPQVVTSQATYTGSNPTRLSGVTNVASIPDGSLVTANGVGREVYVRSKNVAAQTLELSQPLSDADGTQTFTFTRYQYILDFGGFSSITDFEISNVEFQCQQLASGVLLAPDGGIMHLRDCVFNRPGHRGLVSHGEGCQGMLVDRCKFISWETNVLAQDRQSVAISAGSNDIKLRSNRATPFRHFAVLSGSYLVITGNHFFQGDNALAGVRTAGIILARRACNSTITGNYIDNCHIEWTNEREPDPVFTGGFGFAGLTISDNVFLSSDTVSWFSFIVIRPYGTGHFVNGMNVSGNAFRSVGGTIDRVDRVDTSFAPLDLTRQRRMTFTNNTYNNVVTGTYNPLVLQHDQNTADDVWDVATGGQFPFLGECKVVEALVPQGRISTASGSARFDLPYTSPLQGADRSRVYLTWPTAVQGRMTLTARCDG